MWPPSSDETLLARTTIAIAFQRTIDRSRRSSAAIAGNGGSRSAGIVLTYGVLRLAIVPVPAVLGALDDAREQLASPVGPVVGDDRVERLEPLGRLDRVEVRVGAVGARRLRLRSISHSSETSPGRMVRIYPRGPGASTTSCAAALA